MPEKIETTRFGEFTVNDEDIIHFPKGVPGFETHKKWALAGEDDSPIKWLQSMADGDVALPVVIPQIIKTNYNARLPEGEIAVLEASEVGDMALLPAQRELDHWAPHMDRSRDSLRLCLPVC